MVFSPQGYLIAEAGTGHLGSITRAKELVHMAKACGADAVKFQLFCAQEPLFCPIEGDENRHQRWWDTSLTWGEWQVVRQKCNDLKIDFLASVFQDKGIAWLLDLEPVAYKVASRAAKTYPYDKVPGPFIISNGMGLPKLLPGCSFILDCTSSYPTPLGNARWSSGLRTRPGYDKLPETDLAWRPGEIPREETRMMWTSTDGLSDHSGTPWPAIDALARGAKIIEVHFGDKEGPDGPVNLTLDELKLICDFRNAMKEMRGG